MLDYELLPAADPTSKALMVVLHGLGDSMEGYRWWPQAMNLPWLNHVLVNAPDEYYGGYSWYDFANNPTPGIERSRQLLSTLLDTLRERGFPTEQTTLGGFSQGCLMALETGLRYPHKLAGIVGISGYVNQPEQLLATLSPVAREQRLLVTHGTLDTLLPIARTRAHIQQLETAGLKLTWREFAKEHTIAGAPEMDLIRQFVVAGYPGKK